MSRVGSKKLLIVSLSLGIALLATAVVTFVGHLSQRGEVSKQSDERAVPNVDQIREGPGRLSLSLALPAGSALSSVAYAVLSPGRVVIARGDIPVGDPRVTTLAQSLVLPAGKGDTVTFVGTSGAGGTKRTTYLGSKTFDMVPGQATEVSFTPAASAATNFASAGVGTASSGVEFGDNGLACQSCELSSPQGICESPNITATSSLDPKTGEQTGIGWGCGTLPDATAQAACGALLHCLNATDCGHQGENPVTGCYCGAAAPEACIGGVGITGRCIAEYQAAAAVSQGGPPTGAAVGQISQFIATAAGDPTTPIGLANNIKHCAAETHCDACGAL
jgi:hypothetical protein